MKALIKIGGTLLDNAASRHDIARQTAALRAAGVLVAVVHGGGKQMTQFLEERGVKSNFVRGLRVTTAETIDAVTKVLAGSVNTQLVAALSVAGTRPVGLTGMDAGLAWAEQMDAELGFVGRVISSDCRLLEVLTQAGYVPVVACVAGSNDGQVFNVNGDSMAAAIASKWCVDRLLFLTDVEGVLDAEKQRISSLTVADCSELVSTGVAIGGMHAKLNAAAAAVSGGAQEVCIVRGSDPEIITRVFSGETPGTRVTLS